VKKIVIVTNRPEPDRALLASLNRVFPECEVQIVFKKSKTVAEYPASCSSGSLMSCARNIKN